MSRRLCREVRVLAAVLILCVGGVAAFSIPANAAESDDQRVFCQSVNGDERLAILFAAEFVEDYFSDNGTVNGFCNQFADYEGENLFSWKGQCSQLPDQFACNNAPTYGSDHFGQNPTTDCFLYNGSDKKYYVRDRCVLSY